mmetsp:Transcript_3805/g.10778  ORF Transcript_3805/g.10778 Transcript_3805/m.10778 type:complete len:111 (+) Transcript_3805:288-620(+)
MRPLWEDHTASKQETGKVSPKEAENAMNKANSLMRKVALFLEIMERKRKIVTREGVILILGDHVENHTPETTGDELEIVVSQVSGVVSMLKTLTPMIPTMIFQLWGEICI